jgi:2-desacetyl-2-hydroxyethyl bacteriochlorophyllide A dehydrogenase
MAYLVELTEPRSVGIREFEDPTAGSGEVVVRTWYSGISAGTELGMYRGTNPYLDRRWDAEMALFFSGEATFSYPLDVWGYSEVGVVEKVGDGVSEVAIDDVVWGMWGHRSHAVLPAERLNGHRLPAGLNPMVGTFDRVGAVALNAVLAAGAFLGETVVVFGQGVIGLLTTQLLVSQGFEVLAVDTLPARLEVAERLGATPVSADGDVALTVWQQTDGRGADRVIELTGAYTALHEAIRCAGVDGTVVAGGFYQGPATALRLGEEFHHNRVRLVPSQIGAVPTVLRRRWSRQRLDSVVMQLCARGRLDPMPLVTHVLPADRAAEAFELLDNPPADLLQVILDFRPQTIMNGRS